MDKYIIGIDPGLNGGWASKNIGNGNINVGIMPVLGNEIDVLQIKKYLASADLVIIEKVHSMPKQGVASTFKFGKGFGQLIGACQILKVPFNFVSPVTWKKSVLADTTKDKEAAIAYVRRMYPKVELVPKGCRVPHNGIADAICIMDWGIKYYEENKIKRDI